MAGKKRDNLNSTAMGEDCIPFILIQRVQGIGATLYPWVRANSGQKNGSPYLIKEAYGMDVLHPAEKFHPIPFVVYRSPGTLEISNGLIRVHSHHDYISLFGHLPQQVQMANVEHVETDIGRNYPRPIGFSLLDPFGQSLKRMFDLGHAS